MVRFKSLRTNRKPKKHPPIFCVHGYRSSQSVWLPLAKYFQKMNYPGAIITLDVPSEAELIFSFAANTPNKNREVMDPISEVALVELILTHKLSSTPTKRRILSV